MTGLPVLTVDLDRDAHGALRAERRRRAGRRVEIAVGGKVAGQVFEGDRASISSCACRRACAKTGTRCRICPVAVAPGARRLAGATARIRYVPLDAVATMRTTDGPNQISRENGKRRIVVTANVRGRDLGSFVAEAQRRIAARCEVPAGYWIELGRPVRAADSAARAAAHRRAGGAAADLRCCSWSSLGGVVDALLVFTRRAAGADGRCAALWCCAASRSRSRRASASSRSRASRC